MNNQVPFSACSVGMFVLWNGMECEVCETENEELFLADINDRTYEPDYSDLVEIL